MLHDMYRKTLRISNSIRVNHYILQSCNNLFSVGTPLIGTGVKYLPHFLTLNLLDYFKPNSAYSSYMISKQAHTNLNHDVYDHVVMPKI